MRKPTTLDRIRIHCDATSDEDLGRIIGILIRSGHPISGLEHITDVLTYKQGRPNPTPVADKWLVDHPTFERKDLAHELIAEGFGRATADYVINRWMETKVIKKIGPAHYQRADVKTLAAPKPLTRAATGRKKIRKTVEKVVRAGKKRRTKRTTVPRYDVGNVELIGDIIKGKDRFFSADIEKVFDKAKRNKKSVSPILTRMMQAQQIKRVDRGFYEVIKQPASTNGIGAEHG